jgi:hypothetical protein
MGAKNIFIASGAVAGVALLAALLVGRTGDTVSADASPDSPKQGFFERLTGPRQEFAMVPKGTRIPVRLRQGVSTERNNSGDTFSASLDSPLTIDVKTVAPSGATIEGILTDVVDSGRVEGKASLTMILRRITIDDETYTLTTEPLTLVAGSTRKKDAAIIGGSAAAGAVVGAIAGGGKGAAIGAAVGGGSGTGYVLSTKGDPVAYGPETRFTFVLTEAIDLPVQADQS